LVLLFSRLDSLHPFVDTAPIPEDQAAYEGWDGYAQGGEAGQHEAWPEDGANDHEYAQDHWGYNPDPQTGGWETTQYPQQEWGQPTTSPAMNTTAPAAPPAAPPAWPNRGRNPQGAYGAPRVPTAQQPAASSRTQYGSGANASANGWQNWGAEAAANGHQFFPPSQRGAGPGTSYGQQHRVAMAGNDPYGPVGGDLADTAPHAQRQILESILSSRGGAPRQPQKRSARSPARKQSKKGKKERKVQMQSPTNGWGGQQGNQAWDQSNQAWDQGNQGWEQQNQGWEQDNQAWDQDNSGWDREATGWDQQGAEQGGKEASAWGTGGAEGVDLDGDGYTDSDGWNDVTGRKSYRQNVENGFVPRPTGDSPYPMSSRTMAYARGSVQNTPDVFSPGLSHRRNTIHDYENMEFLESYGDAFKLVENAFFGRDRKARDRIHWQFPHDKDERVRRVLEWLLDNAHGVGAVGVSISIAG
jgi:hypothetical protein